jgi:hypothetical protein
MQRTTMNRGFRIDKCKICADAPRPGAMACAARLGLPQYIIEKSVTGD